VNEDPLELMVLGALPAKKERKVTVAHQAWWGCLEYAEFLVFKERKATEVIMARLALKGRKEELVNLDHKV